MRSLTDDMLDLLKHHEKDPDPRHLRLRHPLVTICHLGFIGLLTAWWWYGTDHSFAVTFAYSVTSLLYLSSAAYHTWKPGTRLRFLDQMMIAAFITMPPVIFLYHEPLTLPIYFTQLGLVAIIKWYRLEQNHTEEAILFFVLGASSFVQVTIWGMPVIGHSLWSLTYLRICAATAFFIAKLYVYHQQKLRLMPGWWEAPESGHFLCANGVYQLLVVVSENPV